MQSSESNAASSSTHFTGNQNQSYRLNGHNFSAFAGKSCLLGIDEAGRGPVLGPMVYGGAISLADAASQEKLKELGVADSKVLTEEKRADIFDKMQDHECDCAQFLSYSLDVLPAHYISTCMLRRVKHSLNEISHESAIGLIRTCLDSGILIDHVYVDTVGLPEAYQQKLETTFPSLKITVAKKADSLYPVVSAASVCAKVTRDRILADWQFAEKGFKVPEERWGSGYPSDPDTKVFMNKCIESVFGYPSFVRFSWSTAQEILDKKAVSVKWEDDDSNAKGTKSLLNYLKKENTPISVQRHAYFTDRNIQSVVHF